MQISNRHQWEVSVAEAKRIQERLRDEVTLEDELGPVRQVAGVDVGIETATGDIRAAIVVLHRDTLEPLERVVATAPATFPYVPGYLSFRELPAVCRALAELSITPDLLLCDGQGIAHPRRFGIACHLGVLTGLATLGVGKSRLIGQHQSVPNQKGAWVELTDRDECIGAVVRTRKDVKPIFVSPGHRISLATAVDYVLACTTRYRLPETTRHADRLASSRR